MRLAAALIAALVLTVPAAAQVERSVVAPAAVGVLAADGDEYANRIALLSPTANRGCGELRVWSLGNRTFRPLGPVPCGPRTSTGRGAYGLSFGLTTALWATYTGGNQREHTLWLSSLISPRRGFARGRRIDEIRHDVDTRSPLLIGEGGDGRVAYAVDTLATVRKHVGGYSVQLPSRPLGLGVGFPFLLVRRADGPVSAYLEGFEGEQWSLDYRPGEALAAKEDNDLVVVLRRGFLDWSRIYSPIKRSLRVPRARSYGDDHCGTVKCPLAELRLADVDKGQVVYVHGRKIHLVRLADRKDVVVRTLPSGPVHAELEAAGLSYSAGRRVGFIPRSELARLLRSG